MKRKAIPPTMTGRIAPKGATPVTRAAMGGHPLQAPTANAPLRRRVAIPDELGHNSRATQSSVTSSMRGEALWTPRWKRKSRCCGTPCIRRNSRPPPPTSVDRSSPWTCGRNRCRASSKCRSWRDMTEARTQWITSTASALTSLYKGQARP
ncbi:hypothetical protein Nepgr_031274 [Nepenthes gracilis]|uniref:Uncharacterized protein n=1 Tax=Nepenthes gracilis TaxID=150966 RepID=A0AAD3Y7D8_NEPGR|nr:hypothetical protein Nepgr_031274 [Nepenthes gracilis]